MNIFNWLIRLFINLIFGIEENPLDSLSEDQSNKNGNNNKPFTGTTLAELTRRTTETLDEQRTENLEKLQQNVNEVVDGIGREQIIVYVFMISAVVIALVCIYYYSDGGNN